MIEINTRAKPKPAMPMAAHIDEWVLKPEEEILIVGDIYRCRSGRSVKITEKRELANYTCFYGDIQAGHEAVENPAGVSNVVFTPQGFYVGVGTAHLFPEGRPGATRTIVHKAVKMSAEQAWASYSAGDAWEYRHACVWDAAWWTSFPSAHQKTFFQSYYTNPAFILRKKIV